MTGFGSLLNIKIIISRDPDKLSYFSNIDIGYNIGEHIKLKMLTTTIFYKTLLYQVFDIYVL